MRRRGLSVALIGCDGAGKTTVARALEREPDLQVRYLYMGVNADSSNRLLPTTRLAHRVKSARGGRSRAAGRGEPAAAATRTLVRSARRAIRSGLRLANRVAEEWYRQLVATVHLLRGRTVVFDRHFTADYHAADVAAPQRTLSRRMHGFLLTRLYPRPDLLILLDAPAEVLFARKREGQIDSLARRRAEYRQLGSLHPRFAVVEATEPVEAVVARVAGIIREYGART
jgi:thymidylate kinase